jgi:surface polysaccharide O-acyltransferase-like enzyme
MTTLHAADAEVAAVPAAPPARQRRLGLDLLRVISIAGVLAIHTFGYMVGNDEVRGSAAWWVAVTLDLGVVWVVPVFVMISGALVLHPRAHAQGPWAFYRKRFARILPALVFWHIFYVIAYQMLLRGSDLSLRQVEQMLVDGRVATAMYFLWLIAGLYLVAPILAAFVSDNVRRAVILAAAVLGWTMAVYVVTRLTNYHGYARPISLTALTLWWPYVGYFLAGWALHSVSLGRRGKIIVGGVAAILIAEGVWQWGTATDHPRLEVLSPFGAFGTTVVIVSLCVFAFFASTLRNAAADSRAARWLIKASDASFGVFLVHIFLLEVVLQVVPGVGAGSSLGALAVTYVVVLAASFAVSMVAARIPYVRAVF